ncbi:MAG: hypothetical protein U9O95_07300 [Candidatus Marinimicrobia bacterium]|nr:hypothetical protein [Candidatus Neomarinimicrobiota bacterium]
MKILYAVHQFFPKHYTGTERFTFDLCKQMQKMGYQVDVLTYGIADDTGYEYTKNDFLINTNSQIIIKNSMRGEVEEFIADISKIKKSLGWRSKIPLEEGLNDTIKRIVNDKGTQG